MREIVWVGRPTSEQLQCYYPLITTAWLNRADDDEQTNIK